MDDSRIEELEEAEEDLQSRLRTSGSALRNLQANMNEVVRAHHVVSKWAEQDFQTLQEQLSRLPK